MNKFLYGTIAGSLLSGMLLMNCSTNPAVGTEVENERFVARVVNPDGGAAANATVTILPVTFIPEQQAMAKTKLTSVRKKTDDRGYFEIRGLEDGCYNIYAQSENGVLALFADSVYLSSNGIDRNEFTLDSTGTLLGVVHVQPNHDPRIAEVQILGTQFFANVDSNGYFGFPDIAVGEYRLRCVANREGYIPTYTTAAVTGIDGDSASRHWINVLYTGIPVVENLRVVYDSTIQRIVLSWDKTGYRDMFEYVIYRDEGNVLQPSTTPLAVTQDTFYIDTTVRGNAQAISPRFRVAIRGNSMEIGPTYGSQSVTVPGSRIQISLFAPYAKNGARVRNGDTIQVVVTVESSPSPLKRFGLCSNCNNPAAIELSTNFTFEQNVVTYRDTTTIIVPLMFSLPLLIGCVAENYSGVTAGDSCNYLIQPNIDNLPNVFHPFYDTITIDDTDTVSLLLPRIEADLKYLFTSTGISRPAPCSPLLTIFIRQSEFSRPANNT